MNDKNKKIAFIIFYAFLFLFIVFSINNSTDKKGNKKISVFGGNEKETIVKNYGFSHIINDSIELDGKVYGLKILTTKKENDIETIYYQDGKNIYIKEDETFIKYKGEIVEGIDENLLDILYIHKLLEDETINTIKERTDNTIEVYNTKEDMTVIMYYDDNQEWYKMIIKKDDNKIETRYFDSEKIEDFDVFKK